MLGWVNPPGRLCVRPPFLQCASHTDMRFQPCSAGSSQPPFLCTYPMCLARLSCAVGFVGPPCNIPPPYFANTPRAPTHCRFARRNEGRAFTLCGNPEYLAPEVVEGRGHTEVRVAVDEEWGGHLRCKVGQVGEHVRGGVMLAVRGVPGPRYPGCTWSSTAVFRPATSLTHTAPPSCVPSLPSVRRPVGPGCAYLLPHVRRDPLRCTGR